MWETMNDECERSRETIAAWEEHGRIDEARIDALSHHLSQCSDCRRRFAPLLPLLRRDAGLAFSLGLSEVEEDEGFVAGVMERISRSDARVGAVRTHRARPRVLQAAALAAAALVLVVGALLLSRQLYTPGPNEVVVHFVLDAPGARQVALAGSFTGWNPDELIMRHDPGTNRWEIAVPLERGKAYLYNFVIDGTTWIPDPTTDVQVSDGFGGESSLIQM